VCRGALGGLNGREPNTGCRVVQGSGRVTRLLGKRRGRNGKWEGEHKLRKTKRSRGKGIHPTFCPYYPRKGGGEKPPAGECGVWNEAQKHTRVGKIYDWPAQGGGCGPWKKQVHQGIPPKAGKDRSGAGGKG